MNRIKFFVFTYFFFVQSGHSQDGFDKAKLDKYFNILDLHSKFMGTIAVSKCGHVLYSNSVGFASIKDTLKANENSIYRIGSISKTFTAVLILKAIEQRLLELNQTIDKWFPKLPNADKITVLHLLLHRSGIHNITNDQDYLAWSSQTKNEAEILARIEKFRSDFTPDSRSEYSNSNYILLSYILEKIYKKSFADVLNDKIVVPIGLTSTSIFGRIDVLKGDCNSYSYDGTWKLQEETNNTIPIGAGAIASTALNLTKFADALFFGKLVNYSSLEIMKTMKEGFGMGLFQMPFYEKKGYGHTGGIDGFSSIFIHFPEDSVTAVLISNGTQVSINDIAIVVLSEVFGIEYQLPTFEYYKISTDELDKYLGVYVCKDITFKITISKNGDRLIAKPTNQQTLPLEAIEKDKFKFEQAGALFEFDTSKRTMILFQGGRELNFEKE